MADVFIRVGRVVAGHGATLFIGGALTTLAGDIVADLIPGPVLPLRLEGQHVSCRRISCPLSQLLPIGCRRFRQGLGPGQLIDGELMEPELLLILPVQPLDIFDTPRSLSVKTMGISLMRKPFFQV